MSWLVRALPSIGVGAVLAVGCAGSTSDNSLGSADRADDSITSPVDPPDSVSPATSADTTSPDTTSPDTTSTSSTSVMPPPQAPSTSSSAPDGATDQNEDQDSFAILKGVDWEYSGIPRACPSEATSAPVGCTQVVHDPHGVPISYDPVTRTLARHVRENGEFVSADVPDSYGEGVWLVAAGPDEVVYLNVVDEPGADGSADLVAVALASADAGREIDRAVGIGNPGYDADFVATRNGLVTTDWYGQGQRPSADRTVVMPWVDRDPHDDDSPAPDIDPYPNGVRSITIDAYEHTVTVDERTWQLSGQAAEFPPTGMPSIVATFDGGFVARYSEVANEYRSIVVRGWPDGSVEEWVLPGRPDGTGWTVVPEPMGSVLIANGDAFARAVPFDSPSSGWSGQLDVNVEHGEVDVDGLNDYLATLDWTVNQPPWDIDAVGFANAVAGPLSSPAELRTVNYVRRDAQTATVTVTDERFLDDSVYATRLTLSIVGDLRGIEAVTWTNSCQTGRGHQAFQAANCT